MPIIPIAAAQSSLTLTGQAGFEQQLELNKETLAFEWGTTSKVPLTLELIAYCYQNDSADIIPESLFYSLEAMAHGFGVHELPTQLPITQPSLGNPHRWRAMPGNGIKLRFSARSFRLRFFCTGTAKHVRASVQPVTAGIDHGLLPPLEYSHPGVGIFPALHAFPIGAREWKCSSDNPLTDIAYAQLDSTATLFGAATVAAFSTWTIIPARAFGFQCWPASDGEPITAVFR